jgi:hypothetical protein
MAWSSGIVTARESREFEPGQGKVWQLFRKCF